jgi:FlaA1/EpsC-like NDP-sugar epimerase
MKKILWSPHRFLKFHNWRFLVIDIGIFLITPLLALMLRLDGDVDFVVHLSDLAWVTGCFLLIKLVIAYNLGFYRCFWRYAGVDDLLRVAAFAVAVMLVQMGSIPIFAVFFPDHVIPRSLPILDSLLACLLFGGIRFSWRLADRLAQWRSHQRAKYPGARTLIVGAGSAGVAFLAEACQNPNLNICPIAFIDDDPYKSELQIRHIPVIGDRYAIPDAVVALQIERIIIAIPTASGQVIREILDVCNYTGIPTSTMPSLHELLSHRGRLDGIRDIQIEDLLRRAPIQTEVHKVRQLLRDRRVLVTGAGGSIGSELCRQILACAPTEIALLGKGENSVFQIQQELQQLTKVLLQDPDKQFVSPKIRVYVADIRSRDRLNHIFEEFRPHLIFHAAAHKHVPLMELNVPEAISSNILGTQNLLDVAQRYDVPHFVMISTDKAVNPTNVMGATKRVAEMLVMQAAQQYQRSYVVVRFGNVLGSRGSVVPTFKQQIINGGPVMVTHPEICRYFMTIPEAVQLVLQAVVLGRGGEVMMLDMGQPVKIVDLAKDLIRLSGYEPGKDIAIEFSGLRPGEKLYEELFIQGEIYDNTEHEKIRIVRNASVKLPDKLRFVVGMLIDAARQHNLARIRLLLQQLLPEYQPSQYLNSQYLNSENPLSQGTSAAASELPAGRSPTITAPILPAMSSPVIQS